MKIQKSLTVGLAAGLLGALLAASPALAYDKDKYRCYTQKGCAGASEGNILTLEQCRGMTKRSAEVYPDDKNGGSYLDENGECHNINSQGELVD